MLQFFNGANYNFLRYSKPAIGLSLAFIAASIVSVVLHGGFNMSIDFAGGTRVQVKFEKPVRDHLTEIRASVGSLGFGAPEIKTIGQAEDNTIQITVRNKANRAGAPIEAGSGNPENTDAVSAIREALKRDMADNPFDADNMKIDNVGPKIGGELTRDAVIASVLALLAILIYVGLRFKLSYAVAAVIPLFHDVCVVLGIFSMLNLELTLPFLAAVLTIIGYSLNDTIVVFDRIRENLKGGLRGKQFTALVNASINQTLSRTIITSVTTLFTVLALYILGSDSIKDFALALTIGVVVGTYSTLFIAVSLIVWWQKKWPFVK
jgi:preprotein translocase SecF subunit